MRLTPVTPQDLPQLARWLNDEQLLHRMAVEPPDMTKPYYCLLIRLNDGTIVGWVDVFNVDARNRKAEVGIAIPHRRGRGLSMRVARKIGRFLFEQLQLNRVTLRIPAGNTRSIKLAEMLGFQMEGVERQACYRGGQFEDIIVYGILRSDYEGR